MLPAHDSWLRELMRGMSRKDLRTLYKALEILTSALKRAEQRKIDAANAFDSEDEDNKNGDLAKASHRAATRVVHR
jgi:hypothetical protein